MHFESALPHAADIDVPVILTDMSSSGEYVNNTHLIQQSLPHHRGKVTCTTISDATVAFGHIKQLLSALSMPSSASTNRSMMLFSDLRIQLAEHQERGTSNQDLQGQGRASLQAAVARNMRHPRSACALGHLHAPTWMIYSWKPFACTALGRHSRDCRSP